MIAIVIAEALAIALLGVLVAGLLRSHAEILRQLHDLGVEGGAAPQFRTAPGVAEPRARVAKASDIAGHKPGGGAINLGVSGNAPTLLAFMSSGCRTCAGFWEVFGQGIELPGAGTRLAIVTKGPDSESESSVRALAPSGVTTVMSSKAWDAYEVPVSPYFVLVDQGRVIGEGAAASWGQVQSLLAKAVNDAGMVDNRIGLGTGERLEASDAQLAAAGIVPGHDSLYPEGT